MTATCSSCDRPVYARELCERHYRQVLRRGRLTPKRLAARVCGAQPCERPAVTRGWCHAHYLRWVRTGDVRADLGSQVLVKNPWLRPLGMVALPRLEVGRWHRLLFLKEGDRIQTALDGRWVFDVKDDLGMDEMYAFMKRYL